MVFQRGNSDNQGAVDLTDGVFILNFLFLGGQEPVCFDAADVDDSRVVDISDGVAIFNFLFLGGPRPAPPFEDCGDDPTEDELGCASFESCP